LRVVILAVGAARDAALKAAIREYETRASRYFPLQVIETSAATGRGGQPERALRQEGTELLRRIPEGLEVLALTRTGQGLTSRGLAEVLGEMATYGMPGAAFLVGGAYGLSSEVLARADRRFSLSRMTLPHELARLILVEQLYRAGTILRGEPYHKGG
jgi:23S rRNA (pseudouridine1915-N3)-methyltransferase